MSTPDHDLAPPRRAGRAALASVYAGGFLGSFAGGIVASMLPELGASFDVSAQDASLSLVSYLIPFAALLLVSGTLGERWGFRRTVHSAYLLFVVASLLCSISPNLELFLVGRALQGVSNAFTTPLLLATLSGLVAANRRGRAIGLFASLQATGTSLSPLVGGLAAEVNWRLGFVATAVAAIALAFNPPPRTETTVRPERPRWRDTMRRPTVQVGLAACLGSIGVVGVVFLVAVRIDDAFAVAPSTRGLVLAGFGAAALCAGPIAGRLVERFGARRCGFIGGASSAILIASLGLVPWLGLAVVLWTAAGPMASLFTVSTSTLALDSAPTNRGGAVSLVQSFRFTGMALAPLVLLPPYRVSPVLAFAVMGAAGIIAATAMLTTPQPSTTSTTTAAGGG